MIKNIHMIHGRVNFIVIRKRVSSRFTVNRQTSTSEYRLKLKNPVTSCLTTVQRGLDVLRFPVLHSDKVLEKIIKPKTIVSSVHICRLYRKGYDGPG